MVKKPCFDCNRKENMISKNQVESRRIAGSFIKLCGYRFTVGNKIWGPVGHMITKY